MTRWSLDDLNRRLVRYADLIPCRTAFVDTKTPGSTEKENFTIIGPGVSENADQHVHIAEKHGFNIGGARQPFGCINSQHSHDTAEVFVVHSGRWRLLFGPNREDGSIEVGPGDVMSAPTHMFRGFEKIDDGKGFIFFVLGQDDPGKVVWAPAVLEAAAENGMRLARGGRLIDTSQGDYVLKDVELEDVADADKLASLKTPPLEKLRECVVVYGSAVANPQSALAGDGVEEAGVIVPQRTSDRFEPGPITGWWPHDFNLRQLTLQSGAFVPRHSRREVEVLFVHEGVLEVGWEDGSIVMGPGDTMTVPVGLPHSFRNTSSARTVVFVVRGTENPSLPTFN
ncbi:cupin domain-containing protein [Roseiterribacter gracilis]|uniref:Cupin n=1 Tax=Roseiterribacter gracilis TaxID=2812848 RepID=A0A8S8XE86_9PROT|nr:cupin [Rhodospirillales bacterium TMPK1]